jgi:hypothetical protein
VFPVPLLPWDSELLSPVTALIKALCRIPGFLSCAHPLILFDAGSQESTQKYHSSESSIQTSMTLKNTSLLLATLVLNAALGSFAAPSKYVVFSGAIREGAHSSEQGHSKRRSSSHLRTHSA